ncbi:DUF6293 family protein [Candidatus Aciduliprofundum boonei]|uniref:Uncharacterized protein n=1 Tax=Aciduliprofundum boonei (strain DSM 19572 / T469) TaxID=439481 RepID=B5IHB4_ACIB4|nr:DUF6293 family protein [Candidatus Aciduliprofundum boonei]ADD08847.1 hypothetical protein Aboo_1038 [Aciduliprofundum boonei T469]EDY34353.1 hypothetical protein ABOONEI_982 [Aciduliprofundum boonei T469]HII55601.1 hypothetical protein [Candidatus Aciduliprofundum boonei]
MKLFASTLTIYTYKSDEDIRKKLNNEEVEKFLEGMEYAGEFDKLLIFSDYSNEEFERTIKELSYEEQELFAKLVEKIGNFKLIKVNLTNYDESYRIMYRAMDDHISSHIQEEDVDIKLNVSCGHKLGSLALYLATMNVVHKKEYYSHLSIRRGTKLSVDAYHAEKGIIEKLPTMNFESQENKEWEEMLKTLKTPKTLEEFKKEIRENADRAIAYFKNHKYIEMKDGKVQLTERGKVLVEFLDKIK